MIVERIGVSMDDFGRPATPSGWLSSIHTLGNETLLHIYIEANELQTSEDFIRMLEDEMERRNLTKPMWRP